MIALPNVCQQRDNTCGPSAVLAIATYYGVGPRDEAGVAADMQMPEDGSDPAHIIRALERYGLAYREYRPMTDAELRACLDDHQPVMLMLQAWADPRPPSYADWWDDGHWVIAIDYTPDRVIFEDPSIEDARGFLTWGELAQRWHDIEGADRHHVERYGLAIWKPA